MTDYHNSPTTTTQRRILRLRDVRARTGLCTSSIYDRMARGDFPQSVPLGGRAVGWIDAEIDQWIDSLISKRADAAEGGHAA